MGSSLGKGLSVLFGQSHPIPPLRDERLTSLFCHSIYFTQWQPFLWLGNTHICPLRPLIYPSIFPHALFLLVCFLPQSLPTLFHPILALHSSPVSFQKQPQKGSFLLQISLGYDSSTKQRGELPLPIRISEGR